MNVVAPSATAARDPDVTAIAPVFNGLAAAGALMWCREHQAPYFARLIAVGLALVAMPDGQVGAVAVRDLSDLTGLTRALTRDNLRWLKNRGAFREVRRPGLVPWLALHPMIAAGPVVTPVARSIAPATVPPTSLQEGTT